MMLSNLFATIFFVLPINNHSILTINDTVSQNSEETYTLDRLNLINYFENLTENLGDNPRGTCVDVAFCMAMSYYDTYFNDTVIPEKYDVESYCYNNDFISFDCSSSPGIHSYISDQYYNSNWFMNNSSISSYLNDHNDFMVAKFFPFTRGTFFNGYDLACTPTISSITSLASSFCSYSNSVELECIDVSQSGFEGCVDAIDSGYPIVFDPFGQAGVIGHAVVAYDYDLESRSLIFHYGFKYGCGPYPYNSFIGTHGPITGINAGVAFAIKPTSTSLHVCSNNYCSIDPITEQITYYCPCMLNGASYSGHDHDIDHSYDYDFDEDNCVVISTMHSETCQTCNLTKTIDCGVAGFTHENLYEHTIHFGCGSSVSEDCFVVDFQCVGTDIHEGFCICGSLGYEHHNWCLPVLIDNQIEYICICGLIYYDHDGAWRDYIRDYLRDNDYIDEYFLTELINELYNNPF